MAAGERRTKDQAMAGMLKAAGVERTSGRCPICNRIVFVGRPQETVYPHVVTCRALPRRKGGRRDDA